jgi:hypothetical protein
MSPTALPVYITPVMFASCLDIHHGTGRRRQGGRPYRTIRKRSNRTQHKRSNQYQFQSGVLHLCSPLRPLGRLSILTCRSCTINKTQDFPLFPNSVRILPRTGKQIYTAQLTENPRRRSRIAGNRSALAKCVNSPDEREKTHFMRTNGVFPISGTHFFCLKNSPFPISLRPRAVNF